jgi:hypothetical protein
MHPYLGRVEDYEDFDPVTRQQLLREQYLRHRTIMDYFEAGKEGSSFRHSDEALPGWSRDYRPSGITPTKEEYITRFMSDFGKSLGKQG